MSCTRAWVLRWSQGAKVHLRKLHSPKKTLFPHILTRLSSTFDSHGNHQTIEQLEKDGSRIIQIVKKRIAEREELLSQVGTGKTVLHRVKADCHRLETLCLPRRISSVPKYCGSRRTCRRRGRNGTKPGMCVLVLQFCIHANHKFVVTSCSKKLSPFLMIPTRACAPSPPTSTPLWRPRSPST